LLGKCLVRVLDSAGRGAFHGRSPHHLRASPFCSRALVSRVDLSARRVRTQVPAVGPRPSLRLGPSHGFPSPFERLAK
jgi:hypothetical protein